MTREHKLALIIGFSLVLLIGVLISDHFSRAAELDMAGVTDSDTSATPLVQPVSRESLGPAFERDSRTAQAPSADHDAGTLAADTSPGEAIPGGGEATRTESDWPPAGLFAEVDSPVPPGGIRVNIDDLREKIKQESGWVPAGSGGAAARVVSSQGVQPGAAPPAKPEPAPAKPTFADHTVKQGESLFQIAARHLGDGNQWRLIRDANPRSVAADGSVRAGVRLRIPLAGEPQTTAIRDPLTAPPPKSQPKADTKAPAKPATPARPPTYTVRRGESLGEIALRTLGTSRRANEIAALNGLKDANMVQVGMVLKIPQG